jgi:predicted GNAT family N-acyltransferase
MKAQPKTPGAHLLRGVQVKVANTLDELMQVIAIRSIVYMGEQDCPYSEEFDGNDFAGATHLLAHANGEPAGVMRMRWFAGFAKVERVAVRPGRRSGHVARAMIELATSLAARKGYREILGHIEPRLLDFWKRYGGVRERPGRPEVRFSDRRYIEIIKDVAPAENALSLETPAMVLLRPEGAWDEPGVLDRSSRRNAVLERA